MVFICVQQNTDQNCKDNKKISMKTVNSCDSLKLQIVFIPSVNLLTFK